jgi:pyridoxal phosphate enzyme (YggS family)
LSVGAREGLQARIALVRSKIEKAACRAGRRAEDVTIVAVTKGVDAARIREARALGLKDFGENRVQEARQKVPEAAIDANWHMIGHLQTNKAKYVPALFSLVHSLDRIDLAKEMQKAGEKAGAPVAALVQVNISGEHTKSGVSPAEVMHLMRALEAYDCIVVRGLMTMAPACDNPEDTRLVFRRCREIANDIRQEGFERVEMKYLSMGMSQDFEVAVEEGASMVRIGTAIFGPRVQGLRQER